MVTIIFFFFLNGGRDFLFVSGACQTHLLNQISYLSDFYLNAKYLIMEGLYELWDYENLVSVCYSSYQAATLLLKHRSPNLVVNQLTQRGIHQFNTNVELNSFNA